MSMVRGGTSSITNDGTFVSNVLSFMDADASTRWTPAMILSVAGLVHGTEWSAIVNANQYYQVNPQIAVTTDSQGRIPIANLTTGSGDTAMNFYRILTGPTDGNILWRETDLRYVPLGTQTNYQNPYEYLYYLMGQYFQLLPVQAGLNLFVDVSWIPTSPPNLAGDTSLIQFVTGQEWILVWVTAATLLLKGGTESQAASDLFALADTARKSMLGDIGRRTTRPNSALFNDSPMAWAGG